MDLPPGSRIFRVDEHLWLESEHAFVKLPPQHCMVDAIPQTAILADPETDKIIATARQEPPGAHVDVAVDKTARIATVEQHARLDFLGYDLVMDLWEGHALEWHVCNGVLRAFFEGDFVAEIDFEKTTAPPAPTAAQGAAAARSARTKQRHGCLTVWLVLMIIGNGFAAFSIPLRVDDIQRAIPSFPAWVVYPLAFFGILNVAFAVALFDWKRWGFFGFLATNLAAFGLNVYAGIGILRLVPGLVGIAILYGALQIGGQKSGWSQLEPERYAQKAPTTKATLAALTLAISVLLAYCFVVGFRGSLWGNSAVAPAQASRVVGPNGEVSAEQFRDDWPLRISSGRIVCHDAYMVLFQPPDGALYAVNEVAASCIVNSTKPECADVKPKAIDPIWADDAPYRKDVPSYRKKDLRPLIDAAFTFCNGQGWRSPPFLAPSATSHSEHTQ